MAEWVNEWITECLNSKLGDRLHSPWFWSIYIDLIKQRWTLTFGIESPRIMLRLLWPNWQLPDWLESSFIGKPCSQADDPPSDANAYPPPPPRGSDEPWKAFAPPRGCEFKGANPTALLNLLSLFLFSLFNLTRDFSFDFATVYLFQCPVPCIGERNEVCVVHIWYCFFSVDDRFWACFLCVALLSCFRFLSCFFFAPLYVIDQCPFLFRSATTAGHVFTFYW